MVRILIGFLLLAASPAFAGICGDRNLIDELGADDSAKLAALVAKHPYPTGNFWRAEKPGSTVIVAGTIHIPDARLDPMEAELAPHIRDADLVILEGTRETEAETQRLVAERPGIFFITEGPTLIDLLGPEDWARVENRLTALGVPGFLGAKFQPWYMSMTLTIPACAMSRLKSGEMGLDRRIEDLSLAAGVPIETLDDAETVFKLFGQGTMDEQLDALRAALAPDSNGDGDAMMHTLVESYFKGTARESWEFTRLYNDIAEVPNGMESFEFIDKTILQDRNVKWMPDIERMVAGKDVVLGVGAAHLSGDTGVLKTLERLGYSLSPL